MDASQSNTENVLDHISNSIKEEGKAILKRALKDKRNLELSLRFRDEIINNTEIIKTQLVDFNNAHINDESDSDLNQKHSLEYQEDLLCRHHEKLKNTHDQLMEELDRQVLIMDQLSKTRQELKEKKMHIEDLEERIKEEKSSPDYANKKLLFDLINKTMNIAYKSNGNVIQGVYKRNLGTFGVNKFIRKEEDRPEAFDELMQEALERIRT